MQAGHDSTLNIRMQKGDDPALNMRPEWHQAQIGKFSFKTLRHLTVNNLQPTGQGDFDDNKTAAVLKFNKHTY